MSFSLAIPDWEVNRDEGQIYPPPPRECAFDRILQRGAGNGCSDACQSDVADRQEGRGAFVT